MLVIENKEHFETVKAFAEETGQMEQLQGKLDYLAEFGGEPKNVRCLLFRDFAPHSFEFMLQKHVNGEWKRWFNGGLIYHGSHDRGGDGGAPTFSVNLTPQQGWTIHT